MKSLVLAPMLVFAITALPASAQSAPASPVTIPQNTCVKPDDYPGNLATNRHRKEWQKTMDDYGECVKKYAANQRAIVEAAMKAGNDAVEEYNVVVNKAKAAIGKKE